MKKALSFLLTLTMLLTMVCIPAFAEAVDPTEIADLAGLQAMTADTAYKLTANVTVPAGTTVTIPAGVTLDGNGKTILVSGTVSSATPFKLSGGNKITVSNLSLGSEESPVTISAASAIGLFANDTAGTSADFSNVTIYESVTYTANCNGGGFMSTLAGTYTFTDCVMNTTFSQSGAWSNAAWFGQVENNAGLTFTRCTTNGSVSVSGGQGAGIVGNFKAATITLTDCVNNADITAGANAGGFIAFMNVLGGARISMTNCANYGDITGNTKGSDTTTAAGLVGIDGSGGSSYVNCRNYGKITGKASGSSNAITGGLIGRFYNNSQHPTMTNCVNYGSVEQGNRVGGLVGSSQSLGPNLTNCYNYGAITTTTNNGGGFFGFVEGNNEGQSVVFLNCTNFGAITTPNASGFISSGGSASNATFTLTGCFNAGSLTGTSHTGAFFGWVLAASFSLNGCANIGALTQNGTNNIGNFGGYIAGELTLENSYAFGTFEGAANNRGILFGKGASYTFKDGTPSTGTKYLSAEDAATTGTAGEDEVTLSAAVELMNTAFAPTIFMADASKAAVTIANPALRAVQDTDSVDSTQRIRIIATLDSLNYQDVGFRYTKYVNDVLKDEENTVYKCKSVYTSVAATGAGSEVQQVRASDLFGTYIFAVVFNGVPVDADKEVKIVITPFAIDLDGTTTYYGDTMEIVYQNGVFQSFTKTADAVKVSA